MSSIYHYSYKITSGQRKIATSLTVDNIYNSLDSADTLIKRKTDVHRTLGLNTKHLHEDPKDKELFEKVEITGYYRGKVTLIQWKNKQV